MKKSKCAEYGFWALRLAVGLVFIYQGWGKLSHMDGTIAMFGGMGFPMASFWAWLVALVEFVGGIAVVLGFALHLAALLLSIVLVVALLTVHRHMPFQAALYPISALGSTLALFLLGGGPCQLFKPAGCKGSCCVSDKAGCGDKKECACGNSGAR